MTVISAETNISKMHEEDFMELVASQVEAYEKRFRTKVERIVMSGTLGLWNKRVVGGKVILPTDNPMHLMGDAEVEIEILENGVIQLLGHHHDGTHRMKLYFQTKRKLNLWGYKPGRSMQPDAYEEMNRHHLPLKLSKTVQKTYGLLV